jgi:hypothetical protein
MTAPTLLTGLIGQWHGRNRLWLGPDEPVRESEAAALISPAAMGKFVTLYYTWAFEGEVQEGQYLIGRSVARDDEATDSQESNGVQAIWIDSWHMGNQWMVCQGTAAPEGPIRLEGSYAAPTGPDWGWRTVIERLSDEAMRLTMYNVTPDGQELLAVELAFERQ